MPRGNSKPIGAEFTNDNGYTYVKTATGWRAKHIVILEEKLGRVLEKGERAVFMDGDRSNLDPSNIGHKISLVRSPKARLAVVEYGITQAEAHLEDLKKQREALIAEISAEAKV